VIAIAIALPTASVPERISESATASTVVTDALWMGDSVAYDLAPGVVAAFEASGIAVESYAYPGISLTSEAFLREGEDWFEDHHQPQIELSSADIVFWQLSHFDTASPPDVLLLAHTRFVDIALQSEHRSVVFVTAPPVEDITQSSEEAHWANVIAAARGAVERDPDRVVLLDTREMWATTFARGSSDGSPSRKPDGMHLCQTAVVHFADYLIGWVSENFDGVTPADPSTWALDWWEDERYDNPPGGCDPRPSGQSL
jgi:hypothetical protein